MKELIKKALVSGTGLVLVAGFSFAEVGNMTTGPNSTNDASVEMENETEVDVDNDAHICNVVNGYLVSGDNEVFNNTEAGDLETGDVRATVTYSTTVNGTRVNVTAPEFMEGDLDVVNDTTGPRSDNNAWVEVENETEVDIDNDAHINNQVNMTASSGNNSIRRNTLGGSISTGDVSLSVTANNTANSVDITVR